MGHHRPPVGLHRVHQFSGRSIVDIPQPRDYAARAGSQKRPREANESLTRVDPLARATAGRHGHELRTKRKSATSRAYSLYASSGPDRITAESSGLSRFAVAWAVKWTNETAPGARLETRAAMPARPRRSARIPRRSAGRCWTFPLTHGEARGNPAPAVWGCLRPGPIAGAVRPPVRPSSDSDGAT